MTSSFLTQCAFAYLDLNEADTKCRKVWTIEEKLDILQAHSYSTSYTERYRNGRSTIVTQMVLRTKKNNEMGMKKIKIGVVEAR